jgi:acetyl-CoA carboxylase carboxyltransferase component
VSHQELIDELNARREKALLMGGQEKLDKRKADGVLNARERMDRLLDAGSFCESGLLATSAKPEKRASGASTAARWASSPTTSP